MKGSELIQQIVRDEMPDVEQVRREIHQTALEEARARRSPLRLAAMAAVAVAICLLVGGVVWKQQGGNSFAVKAYAVEGEADGSISLQDYMVMPSQPGTIYVTAIRTEDGYDYREIYLECEGENIKTVEFIAEEGVRFIKRQDLAEMPGSTYAMYGNTFILEGDQLGKDVSLFVGKPGPVKDSYLPVTVTIRAIATFTDGTTQEETFTVHLFGF